MSIHAPLLRLVGVLLAALLLAACGGESDDAADSDEGSDTAAEEDEADDQDDEADDTAETGEGEEAEGAEDDAEADDASESDDAGEDEGQEQQLAFDSDLSVRVTYAVQAEGSPDSEMTISIDGDRYAARFGAEGQEVLAINTPDVTANCFQEGGEWVCMEGDQAAGAQPTQPGAGADADAYALEAAEVEEGLSGTRAEEIAGREATCGQADESLGDGVTGEVCVDNETGMMLTGEYEGGEGGASTSAEAIEFGEPAEGDFELPADPMDMSDM